MTTKKKSTTESATKPKHVVEIAVREGDNFDDATAATLTRPEVQAALTIQQWQSAHEVTALARTLSAQIDDVNDGNMQRPEAMLLSQAHTLDELFNNLARRAHSQDHMKHYETFLRLAFKAQASAMQIDA